jgi:hypothetical protein
MAAEQNAPKAYGFCKFYRIGRKLGSQAVLYSQRPGSSLEVARLRENGVWLREYLFLWVNNVENCLVKGHSQYWVQGCRVL